MAMLASVWVQGLLWAIAIAAAIWILGPAIGFLLYPRRFRIDVSEEPGLAEPRGKDPAYEGRFRELQTLGFAPVGKMSEKAWFFTPLHWLWRGDGSRVFASPDRTMFVSLYRIAGADPLRVNITTVFDEGGALMTTAPGVGQSILSGNDRLIEEAATTDLAALVQQHRQHVENFTGPRALTVKPTTFRGFADETAAFGGRNVPKSKAAGLLGIHFMFAMPLFAVVRGGSAASAGIRPLLICFAAAIFASIRWAVLPARVPRVIRFVVMGAVVMLPMIGLLRWVEARSAKAHEISVILDRVKADAEADRPIQGVERLVAEGTHLCRPLVFRLESDKTMPKARRALHDVLVQIKGSDLGDAPAPWRAWCESTGQRMSR